MQLQSSSSNQWLIKCNNLNTFTWLPTIARLGIDRFYFAFIYHLQSILEFSCKWTWILYDFFFSNWWILMRNQTTKSLFYAKFTQIQGWTSETTPMIGTVSDDEPICIRKMETHLNLHFTENPWHSHLEYFIQSMCTFKFCLNFITTHRKLCKRKVIWMHRTVTTWKFVVGCGQWTLIGMNRIKIGFEAVYIWLPAVYSAVTVSLVFGCYWRMPPGNFTNESKYTCGSPTSCWKAVVNQLINLTVVWWSLPTLYRISVDVI